MELTEDPVQPLDLPTKQALLLQASALIAVKHLQTFLDLGVRVMESIGLLLNFSPQLLILAVQSKDLPTVVLDGVGILGELLNHVAVFHLEGSDLLLPLVSDAL